MIRTLLPTVLGYVLIANAYFAHSENISINSGLVQNDITMNGFITLKSNI